MKKETLIACLIAFVLGWATVEIIQAASYLFMEEGWTNSEQN